jgi:hypothetical protein
VLLRMSSRYGGWRLGRCRRVATNGLTSRLEREPEGLLLLLVIVAVVVFVVAGGLASSCGRTRVELRADSRRAAGGLEQRLAPRCGRTRVELRADSSRSSRQTADGLEQSLASRCGRTRVCDMAATSGDLRAASCEASRRSASGLVRVLGAGFASTRADRLDQEPSAASRRPVGPPRAKLRVDLRADSSENPSAALRRPACRLEREPERVIASNSNRATRRPASGLGREPECGIASTYGRPRTKVVSSRNRVPPRTQAEEGFPGGWACVRDRGQTSAKTRGQGFAGGRRAEAMDCCKPTRARTREASESSRREVSLRFSLERRSGGLSAKKKS